MRLHYVAQKRHIVEVRIGSLEDEPPVLVGDITAALEDVHLPATPLDRNGTIR